MTHTCQLEHEGEVCGEEFDSDGGLSQHLFKSRKDDTHKQIDTRRETYRLIEQWEGEELEEEDPEPADDGGMLMPDDGDGDGDELPTCNSCGDELDEPEVLAEKGTFSCSSCGHTMRWTE